MEIGDIPPQNTAAIVVQQSSVKQAGLAKTILVGNCHLIASSDPDETAINVIDPLGVAVLYLQQYEKIQLKRVGNVTFLKNPSRGTITEVEYGRYRYRPNADYLGRDRVVAFVEVGGYHVKVFTFLRVLDDSFTGNHSDSYDYYCPNYVYKIAPTQAIPAKK
jgi:hypothetical protein